MNIPAIILAGGLGTRLKGVVKDVPKPMAPVNGKPFLHYIFLYLKTQGIKNAILSVGYQSDIIKKHFGQSYLGISILYMEEEKPLGTGGGIYHAISLCELAYVINGDTFFDVDLAALYKFYQQKKADIVLSLKTMKDFDRYGTIDLDSEKRITNFTEKQFLNEGLINGGVYLLSMESFRKVEEMEGKLLPRKFSFEKDILEKYVKELKLYGKSFTNYFIDIGIPEDYTRVKSDFKNMFP